MYNQRFDDTLDFNEDWELAPQIVETVGTGAAPDHSEEVELLVSLEARIEDLTVLRESILDARGMCQGFALEAQRLLPEFDQNAPLGYYTVAPTATRYKVALEEISRGIWALIAAGIAAVIAAIVKFFKWLGGGDESKVEEKLKSDVERFNEVKTLLASCDTLLQEGANNLHGKYVYLDGQKSEHFSLDAFVKNAFSNEELVGHFLQTKDPFFHDLVNRGPYFKQMSGLAVVFKNIQLILRQRLNALEEVSKWDFGPRADLNAAARSKTLVQLQDTLHVPYDGQMVTLQDLKTEVAHVTEQVAGEKPSGELSFDHLFASMNASLNNSEISVSLQEVAALAPMLEKMKTELESLRKKLGDSSLNAQEGEHATVGQQLRHALFLLGTDLGHLSSLTAEVMQYLHRLLYLARNAAALAETVAARLANQGRLEDGAHLDAWKEIHRKFKEKRRALDMLYRP